MNVLVVAVMIIGFISFNRMRREVFPEFELEIALVTVPYPGATPEQVDRLEATIDALNPRATVIKADSVVTLEEGADLSGKRVEVLREVLPSMRRLGLLISPADPFSKRLTEMTRDSATPFGITVDVFPAAADLEQAMRQLAAAGCQGVVVQQGLPQGAVGARIAAARMPAVSGDRQFVAAGGLLAVSTPFAERYRLLAQSLDKVLKGVPPRDLPVVQTTEIQILVNRASARALGLTLPPLLLSRAEEIID